VLTSKGPGDTIRGGAGDDTLNASQGPDVLTGGAGADAFVIGKEPWAPVTITDFKVGEDRLDLSALFKAAGYTGSDPLADKMILLVNGDGLHILFDDDGAGGAWPNYIVNLKGLDHTNTLGQLVGKSVTEPTQPAEPPPTTPTPAAGVELTSGGPGSTLTGGAGADTLHASQGDDWLTGGAGADHFVFGKEPWSPIHITDFQPGEDKIDLTALLDAVGYAGSDPVADGYLAIIDGGTKVLFDDDGPGGDWPNYIISLESMVGKSLTAADLLF
jgi:Ca2+-binding RTX toxin-like protein